MARSKQTRYENGQHSRVVDVHVTGAGNGVVVDTGKVEMMQGLA